MLLLSLSSFLYRGESAPSYLPAAFSASDGKGAGRVSWRGLLEGLCWLGTARVLGRGDGR